MWKIYNKEDLNLGLFTFIAEISACLLFLGVMMVLGFIRKDYRSVAQIISGSLFGITLEYMNVQVMQTYTYSSEFLIQLGSVPDNIPICIGLCWGLIIYACMNVSNRVLNISEWTRSLIDGLLALSIDLSMDTIAIRLDGGFWTWIGIPMETLPTLNSFFGVNYGNFTGWFFVVVIFSLMLRIEIQILQKKFQVSSVISIVYLLLIPFLSYIPLFLSFHVLPLPVYVLLDIIRIYDNYRTVNIQFKLTSPLGTDIVWKFNEVYFPPDEITFAESEEGLTLTATGGVYGTVQRGTDWI